MKRLSVIVWLAAWLLLAADARAQDCPQQFGPAPLNLTALLDNAVDQRPQLATDGTGLWIAVWQSTNDLGGSIGTDFDIMYARSTTNGISWSVPQPLNDAGADGSRDDITPYLTTDGNGIWLVVWSAETADGDRDLLISRSTSNGLIWTSPQVLNTNAAADLGDDVEPHLMTDGAGLWITAWRSSSDVGGIGPDDDILFSRSLNSGSSWSAPLPLNSAALIDGQAYDGGPQLHHDGAGTWLAVWHSDHDVNGALGVDRDILYARSTNGGSSWTAAQALDLDADEDDAGDRNPRLLALGAGLWIAGWESDNGLPGVAGEDRDIHYARSLNNGLSWQAPAVLYNATPQVIDHDHHLSLALDAQGALLAVWASERVVDWLVSGQVTDHDIRYAVSLDQGVQWSDAGVLSTTDVLDPGAQDLQPYVAAGGGQWVAVWQSDNIFNGALGDDEDIFFSRLVLIDCDDGNPCTADDCAAEGGCVHTPLECDDGDPCTVDGCDPLEGCVAAPLDCDDADACTADSCDSDSGCLHQAIPCDDADPCTADGCDPLEGCVFLETNCDDLDACTADSCDSASGCVHEAVDCEDDNVCTIDSCDPGIGCQHSPVTCSDGDLCNGLETCDPQEGCMPGVITDCNGNDILDGCDIIDGTSQDCNANNQPDECDIADGTSQDDNGDTIPDECQVCIGDLNEDLQVDGADLALLLAQWGVNNPPLGDLNFDQVVNSADLSMLLAAFGPCPVTCGDPGTGDCCVANGTPYCADALCCQTICQDDGFCCEVEWDFICAGMAADACAVCQ